MTAPREVRRGQIAHFKIPRNLKFVGSVPMTVADKVQRFKMRGDGIEELGLVGTAAIANSVKIELGRRAARAGLWVSA